MQGVHLFQLASRHADFQALRQQVVATNIANADTPGFRASSVTPFKQVLDATHVAMERTSPGHMTIGGRDALRIETVTERSWEVRHSGNDVSPEQELLKAADISKNIKLNTQLTKTFHRLYMSAVRT